MKKFLLVLTSLISGCSKSLKTRIDSILQEGPFNGVIIICKDNVALYEKAYGWKDFEKKEILTLQDQFMVGSLTKKISAMTAVKSNVDLHQKDKDISLHELLTHTAGISDDEELYPCLKGTYSYSNQGYRLMAQIMEEKTGKTFDQLLSETFREANMKRTVLQPQETQMYYEELLKIAPSLVKSYDKDKNPEYISEPRSFSRNASGGLISTAKDLMCFDKALYERKIWGESLCELFTIPHVPFDHYRWGKMNYSYGSQISFDNPLEYSHSGMGKGGLSTILYYPETKTHVVILENVFWRDEKGWADFSRHDKIRAVVREELLK